VLASALVLGRERNLGAAAALQLQALRWTGARPTFPSFRGVASGSFNGEVEVRVATRADPLRYKAHLAFSRLASVLERKLTPRTESYPMRLAELLAALQRDPAGTALLRDEMAVLNDGTVMLLVSDAVSGREVDFAGGELHRVRAWAESLAPVPHEHRGFVGAYVDTLILDYLAANARRNSVLLAPEGDRLWLVDNGGAFVERVEPGALDAVLLQLKHVAHFSRSMVLRLRRLERGEVEGALHAGPFANWLVATRPISEMLERSRVVQSLVAARIAETGDARALSLP